MAPTPSATPNRTGVRYTGGAAQRRFVNACSSATSSCVSRRSEFTEPVGAAYAADMTVRVSDVSFGVRRTSALARRMSTMRPIPKTATSLYDLRLELLRCSGRSGGPWRL